MHPQVQDAKALKGRGLQSMYAACLFVACRQGGLPRTFKEICAVVPDANKKDIGRCFRCAGGGRARGWVGGRMGAWACRWLGVFKGSCSGRGAMNQKRLQAHVGRCAWIL